MFGNVQRCISLVCGEKHTAAFIKAQLLFQFYNKMKVQTEWISLSQWSYVAATLGKPRSEQGAFSSCQALRPLWDGDWGKELGSLLKWTCWLSFSVKGSALLIWIFTAICGTPVHSIISDYNQSKLSGVCFQVFVFLCHLGKYNGGRLNTEIPVRNFKDTVLPVSMYHPDCS